MRKGKIKEIIKNLLVVIIVTLILISILALIYSFTQQNIAINETLFKKKAILLAAGFSLPSKNIDILNLYDQSIKELIKKEDVEVYLFINNTISNKDILSSGYVLIFTGAGLWGEINTALAFGKDLKTIAGIEFISQNETPGLGGRITEDWFKKQFKGKKDIKDIVPEKSVSKENEIAGITGATNTTKYVLKLIELGRKYVEDLNLKVLE